MFCKRILILQQTDKRFSEKSKELCGMIKLVNTASKTSVTVFVTNANVTTFGQWWVLLAFGNTYKAYQLTTFNNCEFVLPQQSLENVSALLVKVEDCCFEVARTNVGKNVCDLLRRNMQQIIADSKLENPETQYEQFVASTNDYYQDIDVSKLQNNANNRYKSIEDYSSAFDRYYASGGENNYYLSVKKEIIKVFVQFPPYFPLINKYKRSFFVRIDFPSTDKYFVLGVLQQQGKVKYICYGLPADNVTVSDKDFVLVENDPTPFYMLFQDAESGQITVLK